MKFAVVETSGTQYCIHEHDTIQVDRMTEDAGKPVTFSDVLLYADDKTVVVGTPKVASCVVKGTIQSQEKGKKIRVATYRSKSRTRRVKGHRSLFSSILIDTINYGKNKNS